MNPLGKDGHDDLSGQRLAHYEIIEQIGKGGMGVVYRAHDTRLDRMVAIKVLAPDRASDAAARTRFLREARAASALDHPNIAALYEVGEDGGLLYLTMPCLLGETLAARIARGPIPIEEAVAILTQLLAGVGAAHAVGVVHRDIKPANVMIEHDGRARILDFGVAKLARRGEVNDVVTTGGGAIVGTLSYMAPEQLLGGRADARADLWSVGVVAYEMLTGARPFEPKGGNGSNGDKSMGSAMTVAGGAVTIARILAELPSPLAGAVGGIPAHVNDAVMKLLEKDPTRRFQSAAETMTALAGVPADIATLANERVVPLISTGELVDADFEEPRPSAATVPAPAPGPARAAQPNETEPAPGPARATEPARRSWRAVSRAGAVVMLAAALAGALVLARPWLRRRHTAIDAELLASFAPLPSSPPVPEGSVAALGRTLFSDPLLSKNGDVACTSCHPLDRYGADGKPLSRGSDGREPPRNTLSIYNVSGFFALLWDGRQDNLVDQAEEVLLSPRAMAASRERLPETLRANPAYAIAFARAFPEDRDPVSFKNTARALAAFEATLFTRGRWDRFLEGDHAALSDDEKTGFNRFVEVGCIACHFGPNVGATMFQKAGLVKAWPDSKDKGRYEITKRDVDRMVFRVPTLRNVAVTGPYFHDGSVASLDTAIRMMARHQIGRELDDDDAKLILSWLGSLTGDLPAH